MIWLLVLIKLVQMQFLIPIQNTEALLIVGNVSSRFKMFSGKNILTDYPEVLDGKEVILGPTISDILREISIHQYNNCASSCLFGGCFRVKDQCQEDVISTMRYLPFRDVKSLGMVRILNFSKIAILQ